jgi:hypothetical protein
MSRPTFLLLLLLALASNKTLAGAAVGTGPNGELVVAAGEPYTKAGAIMKVHLLWQKKHTTPLKIIASTSRDGECAIAGWRNGKHWAVGVSLGKTSSGEADAIAIRHCLRHCPPGAIPKIVRGFRI